MLSVFGSMFAPDHQRTAAEMLRVTRPGGTHRLASWTPDGFIGQMFRVVSSTSRRRRAWRRRFSGVRRTISPGCSARTWPRRRSTERTYTFRFTSAEEYVAVFRRWYGPTLKAFDVLDEDGQARLAG